MITMREGDIPPELSLDLIRSAVRGDQEAQETILKLYDPYITTVSIVKIAGADGEIHEELDEDKKVEVQMHLLEAIQMDWMEPTPADLGDTPERKGKPPKPG